MIALYSYRTNNIGDDFQSYVIRNALNLNPMYIDRDKAFEYDGPQVNLIGNAFMTVEAHPMSPKIHPLFVALWLGPRFLEDPQRVAFLKQHSPIGCRDTASLERCKQLGIDSYFSGCPTILCEPMPGVSETPGSILLVDVNPEVFESSIRGDSRQTVLHRPVTWTTNVVKHGLTAKERHEQCRQRHRLLTGAELIITNRIHIALPALGMGKAVIFVDEKVVIPGRLTALPPSVRIFAADECKNISFAPAQHRYDVSAYKVNVIEKLHQRCSVLPEFTGDLTS